MAPTDTTTQRDPAGTAEAYERYFSGQTFFRTPAEFDALTPQSRVSWSMSKLGMMPRYLVRMYGRGDPIPQLVESVLSLSALMIDAKQYMIDHPAPPIEVRAPLPGNNRCVVGFAAIALLLVDDPAYLDTFRQLLEPAGKERACLFDALVKAFLPDHRFAKKYKTDKFAVPWSAPVLRALAGPADARADALAAHMKHWCRVMRPWGWKPNLDTRYGKDPLFCDFAFEVALAVCAYDLDDGAFRDHPYYPRDLVDAYRDTVRHTRDAWRPIGAGPGVPVAAPSTPPRADLAASKRKGIARWVELVCDGDVDATEAILEATGKPRKVKDFDALACALAEEGQIIHADLRDDDSVASLAASLADGRALGMFDMPDGPSPGYERARATLLAFSQWLPARGYRLVDLDGDDDAWHAVIVRAEHEGALRDLGAALGLVTRDPAVAYAADQGR